MKKQMIITATSWLLLALAAASAHAQPYQSFLTLHVPDSARTDAWGINNRGSVVGGYVTGGVTHGFLLEHSDPGEGIAPNYQPLDYPGATFTQATAISDYGDIVGQYRLPGDPAAPGPTQVTRAFLYTKHGTWTEISVPGARISTPRGVNERGDVAFEAVTGIRTAAWLLSDGTYTNVEPSDAWAGGMVIFSYASDVGKRGQVVGRYDVQGVTNYGFLLDDGTYTKIEYPGSVSSAALGINGEGDIAGGYTGDGAVRPGENLRRGFLLIDGHYIGLDVPECAGRVEFGGATCTTPRKINDRGQVVGFYTTATGISGFIANPYSNSHTCDTTLCLRSSRYYALNLDRLPPGLVTVAGGIGTKVSTGDTARMRLLLQGGTAAQQQFNQQFVAAQLSLLALPGPDQAALRSTIGCYQVDFQPVQLSGGAVLSPGMTLGELFDQAWLAGRRGNAIDLRTIANLLRLLNGDDPGGRCGR